MRYDYQIPEGAECFEVFFPHPFRPYDLGHWMTTHDGWKAAMWHEQGNFLQVELPEGSVNNQRKVNHE